MTLDDLASAVGVSTAHLSEIERGVKNLNNHLLERISDALGVTPSVLIADDLDSDTIRLNAALADLDPQDKARVAAFAAALAQSARETQQSE